MPNQFANIVLTDTFDVWRIRYNQVQKQMNNLLGANGAIDFTANTVTIKHNLSGSNLKVYANTHKVYSNANYDGAVNFANATAIEVGSISKLTIDGGSAGQYIKNSGAGALSWASLPNNSVTTGTAGDTIGKLNTKNYWSLKQVYTNGAIMTSEDAGATGGPDIDLYRVSASPAVGDILGRIRYFARSSTNANTQVGTSYYQIIDPTNGSMDASWHQQVIVAGTLTDALIANTTGVTVNQGDLYRKAGGSTYKTSNEYIVETQSSLSGANATFSTIPTGTKFMEFQINGAQPNADDKELRMRFRVGGTWYAGATDYSWVAGDVGGNFGPGKSEDQSGNEIVFCNDASGKAVGSDADEYFDGRIWINDPLNTSRPKRVSWHVTYDTAGGSYTVMYGTGLFSGSNGAIQAVDFHWETAATFDAGEIIQRCKD